jgi:hypothetical protein
MRIGTVASPGTPVPLAAAVEEPAALVPVSPARALPPE